VILPKARDCEDMIGDPNNTDNQYFILAFNQIGTALTSGAYTCTLTTSGKPAASIKAVMKALNDMGYYLTQTSTTITIDWQNTVAVVHNT